jgi:hypothetical protein
MRALTQPPAALLPVRQQNAALPACSAASPFARSRLLRHLSVAAPLLLLSSEARAEPSAELASPPSLDLELPAPLTKGAKFGAILVGADVLTALLLGKSVLGIFDKKEKEDGAPAGKKDWKEAMADSILGNAEPSSTDRPVLAEPTQAEPPVVASRPPSERMLRREALLSSLRGCSAPPPGLLLSEVLSTIDSCYSFNPCEFSTGVRDGAGSSYVGEVVNMKGVNEGALKVLAFAALHQLGEVETLCLFAEAYTEVLKDDRGSGHRNVRAFRREGWPGVRFGQLAAH